MANTIFLTGKSVNLFFESLGEEEGNAISENKGPVAGLIVLKE
jgi:hypothetical protein